MEKGDLSVTLNLLFTATDDVKAIDVIKSGSAKWGLLLIDIINSSYACTPDTRDQVRLLLLL